MRRLIRTIPIFLAGALMLVPSLTFAQESLFGPIIPKFGACRCELVLVEGTNQVSQSAPNFGCVLQTVQATINIGLAVGIVIFVFVIAYAGFLLLTNATNAGGISKAKSLIKNAFVGLAIAFLAWLGVDFVMKTIYNPSATFSGQNLGPWNAIWISNNTDLCLTVRNPTPITQGSLTLQTIAPGLSGSSPSQLPYGTESPVCRAPQNQANACSVSTLSRGCFGSRAQDASRVCMVESAGGNYLAESGSDKLDNGRGPSYSVGLWQINLTVHQVGGLNCPAAFTNQAGTASTCGCGGSTVVQRGQYIGRCSCKLKSDAQSQQLYQSCVRVAKDPRLNTDVACRLFARAGNNFTGPWSTTANKCNVR